MPGMFDFIPTVSHEILAELLECDVEDLSLFETIENIDLIGMVRALREHGAEVSFAAMKDLITNWIQVELEKEIENRVCIANRHVVEAKMEGGLDAILNARNELWVLNQLASFENIIIQNYGEGQFVLAVIENEEFWDRAMGDKLAELAKKYGLCLHCPVNHRGDSHDDADTERLVDSAYL